MDIEFKGNFEMLKQIIEYKKEILKQQTKISIIEIKNKLNLVDSVEEIKKILLDIEVKGFPTTSEEFRENFKIFQKDRIDEDVILTNSILYQVEENESTYIEVTYREYLKSI